MTAYMMMLKLKQIQKTKNVFLLQVVYLVKLRFYSIVTAQLLSQLTTIVSMEKSKSIQSTKF